MAFGRLAIVGDSTAGGKTADVFSAPLSVTGARTWPLTKLNFSRGAENLNRDDEMRGTRAAVADLEYKWNPSVTAGGYIYQPILKSLLYQILGVASSSGSSTTGYTHQLSPVLDTSSYGPASALAFKRDTESVSRNLIGALMNELTLTFPKTGQATWEATWVGLYLDEAGTAPPTPDFTYLGSPERMLTGRDGKLFEAGSSTATAEVESLTMKFGPLYEDADWDWGANVKDIVVDGVTSRVWFPSQRVLQGMRTITGSVGFRGLNPTRDLRADLQRQRQLRADFTGRNIAGTSPTVAELARFDLANAAFTGTESGDITRGERTSQTLNFKASSPDATADFAATVIDGVVGPVTVAN